MTTNIVNQVAYLRTSRQFPPELNQLSVESNKAYIDTANAVNSRIIGIFSVNRAAINGEQWYLNTPKLQGLRQVYISSGVNAYSNIPHGLDITEFFGFSRFFGTYTDGTNWYGIVPGSNVAIAGKVGFYVDANDIVFTVGAGAPPAVAGTKVTIVLEWISNP